MKKKFSLNYDIYSDQDRVKEINKILDNLNSTPSNSDLELMANYILYGKDENNTNAIQRKETYEEKKRYNSFKKASEKVESLDAIMDNPMMDQIGFKAMDEKYVYKKIKPSIKRPKFNKEGQIIDPGDSQIPGMEQLWEAIDRLQKIINIADGKIPPDENPIITDSYKLYKMRHQLIELRRDQYYLKDLFAPTIKFLNCKPTPPQLIDWDNDSFYWISKEEWEKKVNSSYIKVSKNPNDYEWREDGMVKWVVRHHIFDWENPTHIKYLIDNYSAIWQMAYDQPYSDARILIMDFDRYQTMADLSPLRQHILNRKIDKWTYLNILRELDKEWNIQYNENHICTIVTTEIPQKIAKIARRNRLLLETPIEERKTCTICKRALPKDYLFFGKNSGRRDGFSSSCKECEKKRRIKRGEQINGDRRFKEANLPQM